MEKRKITLPVLAVVLALALLVGLGNLSPKAEAATSSELKAQINALQKQASALESELQNLRGQISENASQIQQMVEQKNIIDQEMFLLHQQIENINHQVATYSMLIADQQEALVAAQARYDELLAQNRARIQAMEEQGSVTYWSVLFQANSFSDLLDRVNMIREIAASDRRRLQTLSEAAAAVAEKKADLETEKLALQDAKLALDSTQLELEEKRKEADALLQDLVAQGMEYELLVELSEQAQAQLMLEIADKEDEYDEAVYREWLATSVPPTTKPKPPSQTEATKPTETEDTKATEETEEAEETEETEPEETEPEETQPSVVTWSVPISYTQFTSPFGLRIHPVYGTERFHYGVDLAAPEGTPIYATRSGTVSAASYDGSSGYYVQINHGDGYRSIYMHMTHFVVSGGQEVSQGQVIGYCGNTGTSTGSHLHFGISQNGVYVNPANYIPI